MNNRFDTIGRSAHKSWQLCWVHDLNKTKNLNGNWRTEDSRENINSYGPSVFMWKLYWGERDEGEGDDDIDNIDNIEHKNNLINKLRYRDSKQGQKWIRNWTVPFPKWYLFECCVTDYYGITLKAKTFESRQSGTFTWVPINTKICTCFFYCHFSLSCFVCHRASTSYVHPYSAIGSNAHSTQVIIYSFWFAWNFILDNFRPNSKRRPMMKKRKASFFFLFFDRFGSNIHCEENVSVVCLNRDRQCRINIAHTCKWDVIHAPLPVIRYNHLFLTRWRVTQK